MKFCAECGTKMNMNDMFCPNCGFGVKPKVNNKFYKEYDFKCLQCGSSTLIIDDNKLTIKRNGPIALAKYGRQGSKTFLINHISAVQLKDVGISIGYIQFITNGTLETKGGVRNAMHDENTICFDTTNNKSKVNAAAHEIKEYIENYNSKPVQPQVQTIIQNKTSKYDEIAKLKSLLDSGAITKEEFDIEKSKLLK